MRHNGCPWVVCILLVRVVEAVVEAGMRVDRMAHCVRPVREGRRGSPVAPVGLGEMEGEREGRIEAGGG